MVRWPECMFGAPQACSLPAVAYEELCRTSSDCSKDSSWIERTWPYPPRTNLHTDMFSLSHFVSLAPAIWNSETMQTSDILNRLVND